MIKQIARWILSKELTDLNNQITNLTNQVNTLTNQIDRLRTTSKIEIPKILGSISLIDVRIKLSKYCSIDKIFLSDLNYSTTSKEEGEKYTLQSKIDTEKYIETQHDCENYSFALSGYWSESLYSFCFGICWSTTHAYNLFIDNLGDIYVVEPQTAKFYPIDKLNKDSPDGAKYFPITMIVI